MVPIVVYKAIALDQILEREDRQRESLPLRSFDAHPYTNAASNDFAAIPAHATRRTPPRLVY